MSKKKLTTTLLYNKIKQLHVQKSQLCHEDALESSANVDDEIKNLSFQFMYIGISKITITAHLCLPACLTSL